MPCDFIWSAMTLYDHVTYMAMADNTGIYEFAMRVIMAFGAVVADTLPLLFAPRSPRSSETKRVRSCACAE